MAVPAYAGRTAASADHFRGRHYRFSVGDGYFLRSVPQRHGADRFHAGAVGGGAGLCALPAGGTAQGQCGVDRDVGRGGQRGRHCERDPDYPAVRGGTYRRSVVGAEIGHDAHCDVDFGTCGRYRVADGHRGDPDGDFREHRGAVRAA